MSAVETPVVVPQHMQALQRANEVRLRRAAQRRSLEALRPEQRPARLMTLVIDPPDELRSIEMLELLCWLPRVGRHRGGRFLREHRIAETKTLGALTRRQREELVEQLRRGRL